MRERRIQDFHGLPIGRLNNLMAIFAVVISLLLLISATRTREGYQLLRISTEDYIQWQKSAYDLQIASDYLTDQVRCFTVTGDIEHLENYFQEAKETRRRERALDVVREHLDGTNACEKLEAAMAQSIKLMDREYYAMRLTSEANSFDLSLLPEEIQAVRLTALDATLSSGAKAELGRRMVFDGEYQKQKSIISQNMQACLDDLVQEIQTRQTSSAEALHELLTHQQQLIIGLIVLVLVFVLLNSVLVISPLLEAVQQVQGERSIPVHGSYEFRFLARTYNQMFELHRANQQHLAFEATHDPLTGVFNRSGFDQIMTTMDLSACALVLFDLDRFKDINDTYGHDMGDRVLAETARVAANSFRSQDHLCRLGGDEFVVVLCGMAQEHADVIVGKIERINAALLAGKDGLPPVSISAGVAFGWAGADRRTLMDQADDALYHVKHSGRAGCAVFRQGQALARE